MKKGDLLRTDQIKSFVLKNVLPLSGRPVSKIIHQLWSLLCFSVDVSVTTFDSNEVTVHYTITITTLKSDNNMSTVSECWLIFSAN